MTDVMTYVLATTRNGRRVTKTAGRVTWATAEPFPVNRKHSCYTLSQEGTPFRKRAETKTVLRTHISVADRDIARLLTAPRPQWPALDKTGFILPASVIVQELCESRGGRPELSVLTSLLASVDVKIY